MRNPERFDVLVAENFYGDILSDLASELSGSLGLAGSVMAGDDLCCAQAQHGSAPDIENQDKANPVSMLLSVSMLARWLAKHRDAPAFAQAADAIEGAVEQVIANPETRTADIGGCLGTRGFTEAVVQAIG